MQYETFWAHLEIVGTVLLPILAMWFEARIRSEKQHRENRDRLIKIETQVEPLWRWWNKNSNGG
jgi:hypothetical protein